MDHHRSSLRIGAAAIVCALILRLGNQVLYPRIVQWLSSREIQSFLIYLETGRNVRFSPSLAQFTDPVGESPPPLLTQLFLGTGREKPVFSAEDAAGIDIYYSSGQRPDIGALLEQPLQWDLTGDGPTVLILHTHTTESYTKAGESYEETSAFRTLDEQYNMVSIGDRVAQVLTEAGITVIHDRALHDYPSYNGSYSHSREAIEDYLKAYPSIRLVLDLHRDASGDINDQFRPTVQADGRSTAQLMLVMGTGSSALPHQNWEENMALGLKLHVQLERTAPGITRPLCLRSSRYNQDLSPGSLLIEVGAAGNTRAEALGAAEVLAQAIITLARGTE